MDRRRMRGRGLARLLALVAGVVAAGCQSTPSPDAAALQAQRFRAELAHTTEAINAGDLDRARAHLAEADAHVATDSERGKVASLDHLITGAEALMAGDPLAATTEWSLIDDPALNQEVQVKARQVGMVVPAPTNESEATE